MVFIRFVGAFSIPTIYQFLSSLQVETIGDAYMVAAGLLDTPTEHAEAVINMAFGMREEAGKVMEPTNQAPLKVCKTSLMVL